MNVQNMISSSGNPVANQFIIEHSEQSTFNAGGDVLMFNGCDVFQSYNTIITIKGHCGDVYLDRDKWDYSTTTGKYRNLFLNETIKETRAKIKSGVYILADLN